MNLTAIEEIFKSRYGKGADCLVKAPGRINLLGEHTDYNGGLVLPAAIDKYMYFAVALRSDLLCNAFAVDKQEECSFGLRDCRFEQPHWVNYLKGVMIELQQRSYVLRGLDLVFGGDIPQGAGLSSSAALGCAFILCLNKLLDLNIGPIQAALIAQAAENNFVGVNCGIMDQFASMMGKESQVVKLDCKSLAYDYFALPQAGFKLLLCDTGVKHSLADSAYNQRRAQCEQGLAILQAYVPNAKWLRDISLHVLYDHREELDPSVYKKCLYVIQEIERVEKACQHLLAGNLVAFGALMYETHSGLRELYEVSCPELDFLVDGASRNSAVLGARMMGGGFGGCVICLVQDEGIAAFEQNAKEAYLDAFGIELKVYHVKISDGASIV